MGVVGLVIFLQLCLSFSTVWDYIKQPLEKKVLFAYMEYVIRHLKGVFMFSVIIKNVSFYCAALLFHHALYINQILNSNQESIILIDLYINYISSLKVLRKYSYYQFNPCVAPMRKKKV